MAANTSMMVRDKNNSVFFEELLPAVERTTLYYHLCDLCLAPFPKLEKILQKRAVETQLLFGSSEDFLLKCLTSSNNLVSSLLPLLKLAVKNNKTELTLDSLKTAKACINEIINGVEDIIDRYDKQNKSVASCTSDVKETESETEQIKAQLSDEIKSHEKALEEIKEEREKILKEIQKFEKKIQEKNVELQSHVSDVRKKSEGLGIMASVVPFIGPLTKLIYDTASEPGASAKTQALTNELSWLSFEKSDLRNKEWNNHVKMTDLQLKLASLKIKDGTIPDPVHLEEVQTCLTQIQNILIQLQKFWETTRNILEYIKMKTFFGEDMIEEDMTENRKGYLTSIEKAEEYLKMFGQGFLGASQIFSLETKDAYKFLEFTPSPGSEEWKQEYDSVMEKLNKINLQSICSVKDE